MKKEEKKFMKKLLITGWTLTALYFVLCFTFWRNDDNDGSILIAMLIITGLYYANNNPKKWLDE